ncbi:PEP-CTERM sorting domain-containing protein [Rheinheimera sp.]|uniref:PEP-CTERM sorting domain-containing protein n=1 Tax=Rheinheimera sp. TaxID=1869214 RepID=UPI00273316D7|nr:PEP-CTERM sorting domain-containing protein [Rheinheimera sp.]MDP2714609.1 PEP-CTERM sorting domain-containing protein [Rheinheimera sp.]
MLKSILIALSVLMLSAVTLSQPAQAGPILTQEFLAEDTNGNTISIGAISFDTDDLDEWFPGTGDLLAWESFTLFGYEIDTSFFFVSLGFNPDNIFAGLEYINFDVTDIDMTIAFQGFFDLNNSGLPAEYTTFDFATGEFTVFANFAPGRVSAVSAPATIWLLFAAAGGLLLRQRRHNAA